MAIKLIVTLRSGREIETYTDPTQTEGLSPNQCCQKFQDGLPERIETLRIENYIVFVREIESIRFIVEKPYR
jgi:hypothetical protein